MAASSVSLRPLLHSATLRASGATSSSGRSVAAPPPFTERHVRRNAGDVAARAASPKTGLPTAETAADKVEALERSLAQPSSRPRARKGRAVNLAVQGDVLQSSWADRATVWTATGLLGALFLEGLSGVDSLSSGVSAALACLTAYVLADLGTGVYHWGVDNYGDANTPVFGTQIAAFQGHHQQPWTITQREFCNNLRKLFAPTIPVSVAFLALSPLTPSWFDVGISSFLALACLSQQFHAWAHMKKSELPDIVLQLQDMGLLISRRAHGAHHRAPFEGNYCIVSGLWNPILDNDGSEERSFWRKLERAVHARTGVEPRCWHEPTYAYVEQEIESS